MLKTVKILSFSNIYLYFHKKFFKRTIKNKTVNLDVPINCFIFLDNNKLFNINNIKPNINLQILLYFSLNSIEIVNENYFYAIIYINI